MARFFSLISLCKKHNIPFLVTIHGSYSGDSNIKIPFNRIFEFDAIKRVYEFDGMLSTVSTKLSEYLEIHCDIHPVLTTENSIDRRYFTTPQNREHQFWRKFGISDNAIIAISVGSLIPRKNHKTFIKLISKSKYKNVYYILVGEGSEQYNIVKLSKKLGIEDRVVLLGKKILMNLSKFTITVISLFIYQQAKGLV